MNPDRLSATLRFDEKLNCVPGVSGARAAILSKRKLYTVRDLLFHYPHRYIDMSETPDIAHAEIGSMCTIIARVYNIVLKRPKPRMSLVEITLTDQTGTLMVTCFHQDWLMNRFKPGMRIAVSGKLEFSYGFKRMVNPYLEILDEESDAAGIVMPVHFTSEGITTAWMRRLIQNALDICLGMFDPLPHGLRQRYFLMSRQVALSCIHFPRNMKELEQARRRLRYEEVLLLELYLMRKRKVKLFGKTPHSHYISGPSLQKLKSEIPFELTEEQNNAISEILLRMEQPEAMNHLLLGDVGTGKTIVAAHALAAAADSNSQALMMAPTEVLVQQYAHSMGPLLDKASVSWGILTGSTSKQERESLLEKLKSGTLQVLFGTHALIEPNVQGRNISLVIIDEQQRFGVDQRNALEEKGEACDVLSLTATPIPRSMALALFGDTSLSYIKHKPIQHAPTTTKVLDRTHAGVAYEAARRAVEQGRQAYVVCPLVGMRTEDKKQAQEKQGVEKEESIHWAVITIENEDDGDIISLKDAHRHADYLQKKIFPGFKVGLLHGKMPAEEKNQVMEEFRLGLIDILVSTTVIEVGVDVPNATVLVIEDADRFGLSQLHQLRGRVGRGDVSGEAYLISATRDPYAQERLAVMEKSNDGFEIAEYDLALRHEGDILGNRQHGASSLRLINVVRDAALIEIAHEDAVDIINTDPFLQRFDHQELLREIQRIF